MDGSLSLILPVRDAEIRLAARLQSIVESVTELSHQIDIWIVDDGSTDNTLEVASEWSRTYPQIEVLHLASPVGATEAAKLGIQRSHGDAILIHDIDSPLSDTTLRELWAMRDDEELVIATSNESPVKSMGGQHNRMDPPTKLLRRKAIHELRETHDPGAIIRRVTRHDFTGSGASESP